MVELTTPQVEPDEAGMLSDQTTVAGVPWSDLRVQVMQHDFNNDALMQILPQDPTADDFWLLGKLIVAQNKQNQKSKVIVSSETPIKDKPWKRVKAFFKQDNYEEMSFYVSNDSSSDLKLTLARPR